VSFGGSLSGGMANDLSGNISRRVNGARSSRLPKINDFGRREASRNNMI